jgi:hypothetical protein
MMLSATFVADVRDARLHAELRALDLADGVAAAPVLARRRVLHALEALERERHRLGRAEQREGPVDRRRVLGAEMHGRRFERHARELGDVEEVGRAQVLVARAGARALVVVAGPDRRGLDVELDGAGLRRAVERELARVLVEASEDRGEAEVVQREVRERVVRVDVVVLDRGEGRQRQRGGEGDA